MDILSIAQLPGLGSDQWNAGKTAQRNERATGDGAKGKNQNDSNAVKPEDLYNTASLRPEMLQEYNDLNLSEAQVVLGSLAPQIADMSPFRAADLERVTASKLIPSAYV